MPQLERLSPRDDDDKVRFVVESPRGLRAKLKYDPGSGSFELKRALPAGIAYPFDWGFIPGTKAADGDPLDAMAVHDMPTWPGVVIPCRPLALARIAQSERPGEPLVANDRVILVPDVVGHAGVDCLSGSMRAVLESVFLAIGRQTHAVVESRGWGDAASALRAIEDAARAK